MTKLSCAEPPKSKTSKFRVAIKHPEMWKIQSIAEYKKLLAVKQHKKAEQLAAQKSKKTDDKTEPVVPVQKAVISDEQIRRELEILQNNSTVVRNKMLALSSIRHSVLWLLKKAALCERAVIS